MPGAEVFRAPRVAPPAPYPLSILQDNLSMLAMGHELISQRKFDLIHCQDAFAISCSAVLADALGVPLVVTAHGSFLQFDTAPEADAEMAVIRRLAHRYFLSLEEWNLSRATRLIAVSDSVRQELLSIDASVRDKCVTIYNGTYITEWSSAEPAERVRSRYCAEDEKLILLVGGLRWRKGADTAIEALALLPQLKGRLALVGDGGFRSYLERLARDRGVEERVHFAGFIEGASLADHYRAADLVLAPSKGEPFGLTIAEGLSLGKVVISSRVGGIVEQIEHGINGLLCTPESPKELADLIEWVFNNPQAASALAANARERAANFYSWERIARETLEQYHIALAASGMRQTQSH